jgi:lipopolysaccharide assembly protein B
MDFDWQWLLLGLPIAFALGWIGSRFDMRQWRRHERTQPKAYFKGLNHLLNEQPDKAIDAFIEAVQNDPDTTELHFALGSLFRRRGEFERSVRVHQHLLARADLPQGERERAQYALAQDFMKAGLFDRAEEAFGTLAGSPYDTEAHLALLQLHERARGAGRYAEALAAWNELRARHPLAFVLVAAEYAASAKAQTQSGEALAVLQALHAEHPSRDLMAAIDLLDGDGQRTRERHAELIARQHSLSAAAAVLRDRAADATDRAVLAIVEQAAAPLARYRCAACGFEAQRWFWQCPGCLGWDTFPPVRLDAQ